MQQSGYYWDFLENNYIDYVEVGMSNELWLNI